MPQKGQDEGSSPAETRVRASCISSVNAWSTLMTITRSAPLSRHPRTTAATWWPAVEHARVREHDGTSGCERRGEIPLACVLQPLQRPLLAHRLVVRAVELVNLLLQPSPVEAHRFCAAGLNVYAFSAPIPTPYNTITIPSSSDVVPDTRP